MERIVITMLTAILDCKEDDLTVFVGIKASTEQISAAYREIINNGDKLTVRNLWYELAKQMLYSLYDADFVDNKIIVNVNTMEVQMRITDILDTEDFTHFANAFIASTGMSITIIK